jgi:hypothetical protein
VKVLLDELRAAAGEHAVPLAGRELPRGLYLCRLETGGEALVQKLVLVGE